MKYLKPYNESNSERLDTGYIEMCFADIIDDYDANREITLLSDEREIVSGYVYKPTIYPDDERFKESWNIRIKLWDDSDGDVTSAVHTRTYKVGYDLDKLVQEAKRRNDILQDIDIAVKRIKDKYNYNVSTHKEFTSFDNGGLSKQGWKEEFIIIKIS